MPIPVPNAFETASFAANLPAANSAFLPRLLYNTISLSESICYKKLSPNFKIDFSILSISIISQPSITSF